MIKVFYMINIEAQLNKILLSTHHTALSLSSFQKGKGRKIWVIKPQKSRGFRGNCSWRSFLMHFCFFLISLLP